MNKLFDKNCLRLYYIAGSQDFAGDTSRFLEVLTLALQAGVSCFQFRDKGMTSFRHHADKLALAQSAQRLCHQYHAPFIINDDIDLAKTLGADGIHLGQSDVRALGDTTLFELKQHFSIIGLSINTVNEALVGYRLYQQGVVDYFGVGPIFATNSKSDHSTPVGVTFPQQLRDVGVDTPLVAIGGIKAHHVKKLISHGVDGVAVISAISGAKNVAEAVSELLGEMP